MSTETKLDDLLRRWEEGERQGAPVTPEDLCRGCPELLDPFRQGLAALQSVDRRLQVSLPPKDHRETTADDPVVDGPVEPALLKEVVLMVGAEPVPGYFLRQRLGQGGFGEVWKAEGPGGFHVALKFVRRAGRLEASETQALRIIKNIRHPNLLSTFGAWQTESLLIIAMELADCTLGDRCAEAQTKGHSGIPGLELLEYCREAAKGIDFLNEPRHLVDGKEGIRVQHRDIKPHNILLVGNGVKVADFGLVRLLEQSVASHSGD